MKRALLNKPSAALGTCELTFIERSPIHLETALRQHAAYAETLRGLGIEVRVLELNQASPDAVFVEDVAIVLDERAIIASLGTASRRGEIPAMADVIRGYREMCSIELPATIEGGDVLRVGKTLFVGLTTRTNREGIRALEALAHPLGYRVVPVAVHDCLHLKTCVTALNDEILLRNPAWLDAAAFAGFRLLDVAPEEPWGANVLRIDDRLVVNAAYPRTAEKIAALGFDTRSVDISEFGKAEAGLTCLSLIFTTDG